MNKLQQLQEQYLSCKAEQERIEKLVYLAQKRVLRETKFNTEYTTQYGSKRILLPIWDFRMSEVDFKRYSKLCYKEYLKSGLDVLSPETTPYDKSFNNLKKAEDEFLKFGINLMAKRKNVDIKDLEERLTVYWTKKELVKQLLKLELHTA